MWSFLVSLTSILLITNSQQYVDICFWGADDICVFGGTCNQYSVTARNGLYRYAGTYQGDTNYFYKLDRSQSGCTDSNQDYLYMYKQDADDTTHPNKWIISATPPGNDQFFYGVCSPQSSSPLTCGVGSGQTGKWTVSNIEQQRAYTEANECPSKDCASISVSVTNGAGGSCEGAAGNFMQTGPNMFTATTGATGFESEWVWWFNPLKFQWICTRTKSGGAEYNSQQSVPNTEYGVCPDSFLIAAQSSSEGRVLERADGYEGPFNGNHADDAGSGATYTFTCVGAGTGATYTKSPTTPRPTIGPTTPIPTFLNVDPTGSPTTATPTSNPTTAAPVTSNNGGSPTSSPSNKSGSSSSGNDGDGLQTWHWIIIIICIVLICCCCICLILFCIKKKKKGGGHSFE